MRQIILNTYGSEITDILKENISCGSYEFEINGSNFQTCLLLQVNYEWVL